MVEIQVRNRQPRTSSAYIKKTAAVRSSTTQFERDLTKLRDGLIHASVQSRITQRESDRRQTLIDQLVTKQRQLELAFKNQDNSSATRSALMSPTNEMPGFDPWLSTSGVAPPRGGEADDADMLDIGQIRQQQQRMIDEQDQGLDALSRIIGRQKQIALDIGGEVEAQNEIIDDITDYADQTNVRLLRETKHVTLVEKKSNTCWLWVVIVLLLIAIIVIVAVPYTKSP